MAKVYYNQADSRWGSHPYPSANHPYATVKSSGCGTTCAAMVVSSCRETVRPDTMADISRENGYRALEGTSDGLFSYIAQRWNIEMKRLHSSYETLQACKEGYFVIIACGAGLWTTGGHYILAVGANNDQIEIYDPYLYAGKFNSSSRRGKVNLVGNSAWVQIDTFKANSNAQRFFAFKIDDSAPTPEPIQNEDRTAWVNTESKPLNVRDSANGNVIGSLAKGTQVTVHETSNGWARIDQGWVSAQYLTYSNPTIKVTKYVKVNSKLNVRSGAGTGYRVVGSLSNGQQVTVYEETNGWSRIGDNQWVASQYLVSNNSGSQSGSRSSSKYVLGRYKVTASKLNVRTGAGTNNRVKKTYKKGTIFDTYELKGSWARTPSGWICLDYCSLIRKY